MKACGVGRYLFCIKKKLMLIFRVFHKSLIKICNFYFPCIILIGFQDLWQSINNLFLKIFVIKIYNQCLWLLFKVRRIVRHILNFACSFDKEALKLNPFCSIIYLDVYLKILVFLCKVNKVKIAIFIYSEVLGIGLFTDQLVFLQNHLYSVVNYIAVAIRWYLLEPIFKAIPVVWVHTVFEEGS